MITYSSTNSKFSATLQGDYNGSLAAYVYTLSRSMLRVKREDSATMSLVHVYHGGGGITGSTTYYTDPDGVIEIPLRNLVNKFYDAGVASFGITITLYNLAQAVVDSLSLVLTPQKGISYYETLAPLKKQCEGYTPAFSHLAVCPPTIMLNPTVMGGTLNGQGIIAESNFHSRDKSGTWAYIAGGVSSTITPTGDRLNQLEMPRTADFLVYTSSDHTWTRKWKLEDPDYCTDVVVVRWTSMTGAVRQHYFPVVSFINNNDKEVSIVEAGNGYDVRKNPVKGVRCRICGLTSYDCWYYQDLLLASDAHAVLLPTFSIWSTEIASKETAVFAEGGMESTPEGNGFYNFEFTLKLRHYDTV